MISIPVPGESFSAIGFLADEKTCQLVIYQEFSGLATAALELVILNIRILESLEKCPPEKWNSLVPAWFPFAKHQFLEALESTKCLGARTGWQPLYLIVENDLGDFLAATQAYIKTNSYGEFIFDFAWAQASESAGLEYYPKLVSAVPFTAATGPKILVHPSLSASGRQQAVAAVVRGLREICDQNQFSSAHALFITAGEIPDFEEQGYLIRHSYQYHWENKGYQDFESFLADLRSKRRKEILRERSQARDHGIEFLKLSGDDLKPEHAWAMADFYEQTCSKKGGFNYLTAEFFEKVFATMKENIFLSMAVDSSGEFVAGALNYFGDSILYGRNWGSRDDYKSLHFELCYYQGIEFAIERKFKAFEAGAQGEHKFQRGFLPSLTYSAHWIRNESLREAIDHFTRSEKRNLKVLFEEYSKQTPFPGTL